MLEGIGSTGSGYGGAKPIFAAGPRATPEQAVEVKTLQAEKSPVQVIYNSPTFKIDPEANMAIFVVRNRETGAVINQYPSEKVVQEYKRADAEQDAKLREHVKVAAERTADIVAISKAPEAAKAAPVAVAVATPAPAPAPAPKAEAPKAEAPPPPEKPEPAVSKK